MMSVPPPSGQSYPASDSSAPGSSFTGGIQPVTESETVINPERRGRLAEMEDSGSFPRSSVWNRLFPPDSEYLDPQAAQGWTGLELGHFVVEERIGMGGMGAVFRAMDSRLQRAVALKVLSPGQSRDPSAVQRFRNEARAAARLDHENIARVYFIGEDKGLHYIAFEYVIGTNVRDLIRQRGHLDPEDAVGYALQIASALKHTSSNGVVHRDIKPSNIIITPAGRAKLVDLGLARKEHSESVADLTMAGTTLGTFDYISPEQAKDPREVDVRSDIYSLGCTIYHMLTGEPPYPEGTVLQKLLDHQGKDPPNPTIKNRRVSEDLAAIIRKMMASDPKRRYATPDLLIHDLMLVAGTLGLRGVNPEGLVWMSSRPASNRFWERHIGWIATAASLLLFVAVLQWFPSVLDVLNSPIDDGRGIAQKNSSTERAAASDVLSAGPRAGDGNRPANTAADVEATLAESGTINGELRPRSDGSDSFDATVALAGNSGKNEGASFGNGMGVTSAGLGTVAIPPDLAPDETQERGLFNDKDLRPLSSTVPVVPNLPAKVPAPPESKSDPSNGDGRVVAESTTTSTSTGNSAVADPVVPLPEDPRPISVIVNGTTLKKYRTLEAACSEAEDGSVIELRFDGMPPEGSEGPLRISRNVTIRAAEGYRPLIVFEPVVDLTEDHPRMITVNGGSLDLINVGLRLIVPTDLYADGLALFSLQRPDEVNLDGVTIDVVNPEQYPPTVVLELMGDPSQTTSDMRMMQGTQQQPPVKLTFKRTFVRGECDLIVVRDSEPARIEMTNSVITIEGGLIRLDGSDSMPEDGNHLELRLEHLTAALGRSLLTLNSEEFSREFLPIQVTAQNNIFTTRSDTNPLISMLGDKDAREFRQLLSWKGHTNFYDRFQQFWAFAVSQDTLPFEAWKKHWDSTEVGAHNTGVVWSIPWWEKAAGESTPRDFTIRFPTETESSGVGVIAIKGATDGSDAGADLDTIPPLPKSPSAPF